jgi:hypothetical protein
VDARGDRDNDETAGGSRPGPVYDAALKAMFEADLLGACRLLGVPVTGELQALSGEFTLTTQAVDLLARIGPGRLMHVEYARRASTDLVARMLVYRGLLMQEHPKHHISQHIVVLGEGTVSGHDDYAGNDFAVSLGLLYLRSADPDRFVKDASFAPLAMLRRGDPTELERVASRVVEVVRSRGGERVGQLLEFTTVLAVIASDPAVVEKIIEETEMTVESVAEFYRDTGFGRRLRDEGREEGREEERESLLAALLADRFGEHPALPALARRLARLSDGAAAVHAITTAATLEDLQQADPLD